MKPEKIISLVLLLILTPVTLYALAKVGYWGILQYHLPSPAGWQVMTDLVVALLLVCAWMIRDAKLHGRNVIPFILLTLVAGSFGPLVYLLTRPSVSNIPADTLGST
ncbi:MAG: hypothetical protein AAF438_05115 [Pseudomonadota bacterium]